MYKNGENAEADYKYVATVVAMASEGTPTQEDIFLHFYNMCEMRREGKGIQEWMDTSGF